MRNESVIVQNLIERIVVKESRKDIFWTESHFLDQMLVVRFKRPIAYVSGYPAVRFHNELLKQHQYGNVEVFRDAHGHFTKLKEAHGILKMGCNDALFLRRLEHLLAYDHCFELLTLCAEKNIFLVSFEERLFISGVRIPILSASILSG